MFNPPVVWRRFRTLRYLSRASHPPLSMLRIIRVCLSLSFSLPFVHKTNHTLHQSLSTVRVNVSLSYISIVGSNNSLATFSGFTHRVAYMGEFSWNALECNTLRTMLLDLRNNLLFDELWSQYKCLRLQCKLKVEFDSNKIKYVLDPTLFPFPLLFKDVWYIRSKPKV